MTKKEFNGIKVIQDPDIRDPDDFDARRPYYRIRGPRVTEQQAFEIIRRTDSVIIDILGYDRGIDLGYIWSQHIRNNWFSENSGCSPEGWCHPNGLIGCNAHTNKYPMIGEYLWEFTNLIREFPFLDMVVAVTDWDEIPPYAWDVLFNDSIENRYKQADYMDYPDFIENIEIGFWLHDRVLEVLNKSRAQKVYKEYEAKYEEANKDIYVCFYYRDNHIFPADFEYLKRIVVAYGLDPDKELEHYYFKDWLEGKPDPKTKRDSDDSGQSSTGSGMCVIGG